jgi:hypothetical protein
MSSRILRPASVMRSAEGLRGVRRLGSLPFRQDLSLDWNGGSTLLTLTRGRDSIRGGVLAGAVPHWMDCCLTVRAMPFRANISMHEAGFRSECGKPISLELEGRKRRASI